MKDFNELKQEVFRLRIYLLLLLLITLFLSALAFFLYFKQRYIPVIIHKNSVDNTSWVSIPKKLTNTSAMIKSDIYNYVITRESYNFYDYDDYYSYVASRSYDQALKTYEDKQNPKISNSAFIKLGENAYRKVKIDEILFANYNQKKLSLSSQYSKSNFAIVYFHVTYFNGTSTYTKPFIAHIKWVYKGINKNIEKSLDNWNGFSVVFYESYKNI